jgi:hypothetical protein
MRRRNRREPDFPGNEFEQAMVLAAEAGDDAKFLRALARTVVCLGQPADTPGAKPPGGGPAFLTVDVSQQPLPVAEAKDGKPVLLAFSSGRMLFRWYTEDPNQVWMQTPAGPPVRRSAGRRALGRRYLPAAQRRRGVPARTGDPAAGRHAGPRARRRARSGEIEG